MQDTPEEREQPQQSPHSNDPAQPEEISQRPNAKRREQSADSRFATYMNNCFRRIRPEKRRISLNGPVDRPCKPDCRRKRQNPDSRFDAPAHESGT